MQYEAIKNSTKQSAICNVDVWETLRGDITLEVNSCDFTVKPGAPTATFVEPWTEGFKQDGTDTVARSAVIAAKGHHFPDHTVVYSCSVWTTPKSCSPNRLLCTTPAPRSGPRPVTHTPHPIPLLPADSNPLNSILSQHPT